MYRNAKKLLKLFVLLLFLFTSHIVKVHTFFIRLVKVEILWLQTKLVCRLERTGGSTCETAANKVITLGIMLVHIVLHVQLMPVIQEFELIKIISFIHGRISYKHAGFHYISYILQLKRNRSFSDLTAGAVA